LCILEEKAWDLLLIPFSPEIAAATSSILSTRPATRSVSSGKSSPPSLSAPSDITSIPREVLAAAAAKLDLPIDELTFELLGKVTHLDLESSKIRDLNWAPAFPKLEILDLIKTQVSDLSPLSGISGLQKLLLDNTQVSDLSPLYGISGLRDIWLGGTPVSKDEAAIAQLRKALPKLDISGA
jgi:Leucine-rich repeat (LRR) protein